MMNLNFKTLSLQLHHKNILMVTLNRPAVMNAINIEMMNELHQLWQELNENHGELRCIIITGAEKAFCAGADLKERQHISLALWKSQLTVLRNAMIAMLECPIPVLSAVNGPAYGGGLEMILASDFAYAADTVVFAQSEVKLGIMPGALGTQHLPRACGLRRAKELTFTGQSFTAKEAFDWGIINKICDKEHLLQDILETAHRICANAPLAIQQIKKSLNKSQQLNIKMGFEFELKAYNRLLPTKDREEGIKAFNEKRKPVFIGE
jgi:enoyl-CoA hydratase/carnithine racemase